MAGFFTVGFLGWVFCANPAIEFTTDFLKEVWTPSIFKCCSSLSHVLCSHSVFFYFTSPFRFKFREIFRKTSVRQIFRRRKFLSAKIPFSEISVQRKFDEMEMYIIFIDPTSTTSGTRHWKLVQRRHWCGHWYSYWCLPCWQC